MAEDNKAKTAPAKTVTLFNRGIRTFHIPGGRKVAPGQTVEVDEGTAARLKGYRDLVDAGSLSPKQKERQAKLEQENATLQAQVDYLKKQLADRPAAPAPDAPPAVDGKDKKEPKPGK